MKKFILGFILTLAFILTSNAQKGTDYTNAIGLKLVNVGIGGVTFKHFFSTQSAIELMALTSTWSTIKGYTFTGYYEYHIPLADGFQFFLGGGAHLGFYSNNVTTYGIDGILGIDYKFQQAPINLSLDWKPYWNLSHQTSGYNEIAIAARFAF